MSETYSPRWCPNVSAEISEEQEDGKRIYRLKMRCSTCGEERPAVCGSGLPRNTVLRFALSHLHRDPLNV